jgi:hypothetical protein
VTKNRLVFRQTSKEPSNLSPGRDPVRARMSSGCPRLADKPKASSLVVNQWMNSIEVEEEGRRVGAEVVD